MKRFIVKNVAQLWTRHTCKNITGLFMKAKETTNVNTAEKNTLIKKASVVMSNENMIMSEMNNAISVENYFSPKKFWKGTLKIFMIKNLNVNIVKSPTQKVTLEFTNTLSMVYKIQDSRFCTYILNYFMNKFWPKL